MQPLVNSPYPHGQADKNHFLRINTSQTCSQLIGFGLTGRTPDLEVWSIIEIHNGLDELMYKATKGFESSPNLIFLKKVKHYQE